MKALILVLFLLLRGQLFAQEASQAVKVNIGVVYSEKRLYRGALIWDAPIMAAGPSFIFYNTVSLGQGGLSVFRKFADYHTVTLGASHFDDHKPSGPVLKLKESEEDFKNKRQSTYGTYLKYDFKLKQYLAMALSYHKDLKRNKGNYLNGKISTSIIPFLTLGSGLDLGDAASNKYAYGPEGVSGVGHLDNFASISLPFLPWKGKLMINYNYLIIVHGENKNADFVRGNDTNSNFSVIASWSF
ncbi:MAG: hypothetical protein A2X86_00395 [Bdellovibrionales bacterium GWA2_49_15]|nr:MAG: hypothetical protein A2X86_00395 [Bdellovibrionales bacterium GWA2_49_15]HAZ14502.1 hypothetical protein [Bdellovibrionales bacterium]